MVDFEQLVAAWQRSRNDLPFFFDHDGCGCSALLFTSPGRLDLSRRVAVLVRSDQRLQEVTTCEKLGGSNSSTTDNDPAPGLERQRTAAAPCRLDARGRPDFLSYVMLWK